MVTMCVYGMSCGWPCVANAQIQLVLAAPRCDDIQIGTQRMLKLLNIAVESANLCRKKCAICTLCLNVRKMRKYAVIAYLRKTERPSLLTLAEMYARLSAF